MEGESLRGVGGWLWVYVVGSIPPLAAYSMGLSGWFLDYPVPLMVAILLVFAIPLALIPMRSPRAPGWNVALWWVVFVLMTLRSLTVVFFPTGLDSPTPMRGEELRAVVPPLAGMVAFALAWAAAWTIYFRKSARVRATFRRAASGSAGRR